MLYCSSKVKMRRKFFESKLVIILVSACIVAGIYVVVKQSPLVRQTEDYLADVSDKKISKLVSDVDEGMKLYSEHNEWRKTNKLRNVNDVALGNMELYVRMCHKQKNLYKAILVQSMKYFWPENVPLVVVLDAESAEDRIIGEKLVNSYPYPRVEYEEPGNEDVYHKDGKLRMQRNFFYPEQFVKKDYVGYVDTDALFVTEVTSDLLFENGLPVVIGLYGRPTGESWSRASVTTTQFLKKKEVMRCMAYFPVIMKVQHIIELRKYIEKLHNSTFDNVYRAYTINKFSQFSIMCNYMWMFHRNEYKFYFQLNPSNSKGDWHGEENSPGRVAPSYYVTNVTPEQKYPKLRVAVHYRYFENFEDKKTYRRLLKTGICFSGGFELCREKCNGLNRTSLHQELFLFNYIRHINWTWDKRCIDAQEAHYQEKANNASPELKRKIQTGCEEVDNLTISL